MQAGIIILKMKLRESQVEQRRLEDHIKTQEANRIALNSVTNKIVEIEAAIKELEGNTTQNCPACHNECQKDARYCSDCGYELGK